MGKSLVYGVGTNDADYIVKPKINGKRMPCPFYATWLNMLVRCYSASYQARKPTYIGCTVCDEWLTFSVFKSWMEKQKWKGLHLDKDILNNGNKIYNPDDCVFVSLRVNNLLINAGTEKGKLPKGVIFCGKRKKFEAKISVNGKNKSIGRFSTPEDANRAYCNEKRLYILRVACAESEIRVKNGLYKHSELYR